MGPWARRNRMGLHMDGTPKIVGGTPKSSILMGCSIINNPFWGTTIFGNTHIVLIFVFFFERDQSLYYTPCFMIYQVTFTFYWNILGEGYSQMIPIQNVHRLYLFVGKSQSNPFRRSKNIAAWVPSWKHQNWGPVNHQKRNFHLPGSNKNIAIVFKDDNFWKQTTPSVCNFVNRVAEPSKRCVIFCSLPGCGTVTPQLLSIWCFLEGPCLPAT